MTQGEIEALTVAIEKSASRLELDIMKDIVRRIKANDSMTSSAEWQIDVLRQMGLADSYIKEQLRIYLKASKEEINRIFSEVAENEYSKLNVLYESTGKAQVPFGENVVMQNMVQSVLEQTKGTFENMTQTTAIGLSKYVNGKRVFVPVVDYYRQTLDDAVLGVKTGAFSYNTALKKVVQEMTRSGLRTVDYASNRSYRIESAARTALMTGFRQVTRHMNEQVAEELGTDDYETTYHMGARLEHQLWQGRVYSYQELIDVCGLGKVTGLCGANCYHWYEPFIRGVSVRNYTDEQLDQMMAEENRIRTYSEKEYTLYTALQKQRDLELVMRKQRQDIALLKEGKADNIEILGAQARYRTTMQEYVEFSKAMELPEQRERIYMDGLGRVAPTIKTFTKNADNAIIKPRKMYRKKSENAIEPMPKKQLQQIVKAFKRNGGVIQMNESTDAYLDYKKAEAITYDAKTILLRQKPGRGAVFEELIHAAQYRNGENDGSYESRLRCEIAAQEKLIKYQKSYKLTEQEVKQTEKALKEYQKELRALLEGVTK